MPERELTKQQCLVRDLRDLADYLEARQFPKWARIHVGTVYVFCNSAEEFGDAVSVLGECTKNANDLYLNATHYVGNLECQVTVSREKACERVKVGEKVIPATPEHVIPATPERSEDVYDWKCPQSFIALADNTAPDLDESDVEAATA